MSSELPSLSSSKLIRLLKKNGFEEDHQTGSHLTLRHEDGRRVVVPVHSGKDIGKGLLRKIMKQAGLSAEDLRS